MKLEPRMLGNKFVRLEPIAEVHREGLRPAAAESAIWTHIPFPVICDGFDAFFDMQLTDWTRLGWQPYTVYAGGAPVGQTSHMNLRPPDSSVEIGGTWYAPRVQGGAVNPSCKHLLLGHAFDSGAERVELKTDALNARSRAAILKLGASFEGIHRRHMRRADGTLRDTAWFSILREEWPGIEPQLAARIAAFG